MADLYYTAERNHLILISLLKAYGIRRVIASPGATNICLVASLQHDPFFEMYSCVDERSAAYMACGLAEESGEPVVLSCTGATSSREYMSGLTEAFYRKLPILTVTSSQDNSRIGHLVAQVTDRSQLPNDIAVLGVCLQTVKDERDEWDCVVKANKALSSLKWHGGGPVHINLITTYCQDYNVQSLPHIRKITRFIQGDQLPEMPQGKIAVFVGAHHRWSKELTELVDRFCANNDAVVLCDISSNFHGKYAVRSSLAGLQQFYHSPLLDLDLLIHIGEVSGGYEAHNVFPKQVWRVSLDGEMKDLFKKLSDVFEMQETVFFDYYSKGNKQLDAQLRDWQNYNSQLQASIPELPFSNIWIAQKIAPMLPEGSVAYFAILSSLRAWNLTELPSNVASYSNTGGFGIDGFLSTIAGASLYDSARLYFTVLGDLAFFYDMNALGNRHIGNNLRIMVINNGCGMEFKYYSHLGHVFGADTDEYISAARHFGNQSPEVVRSYVESLGYDYMTAHTKEEFELCYKRFINKDLGEKSIVFEVFCDSEDEAVALQKMKELRFDHAKMIRHKAGGLLRTLTKRK